MATRPQMRTPARSAAPARAKFTYTPRTPEQVKERASQRTDGRDSPWDSSVQFFTPAEGDNSIRILPPPSDADWGHYGFPVFIHYDIGADKNSYLCLDRMKGEPCPICEERERASGAGEDELAKELKAGSRLGVYVIDRSKPNKGPLLWNLSGNMDQDILKLTVDGRTGEVLPIDHPDEGYDLTFNRKGAGMTTKYTGYRFDRAPSPLSDDQDQADEWLAFITEHPVDGLLSYKDYAYIDGVFSGTAAGEETAPARAPAKTPAKAAPDKAPTQTPEGGSRPRLAPRGSAKPAPAPAPEVDPDLPTWDQLLEMDDTMLGELGDEKNIDWSKVTAFDDIEHMRQFVAEEIGIEIPGEIVEEVVAAPAAGGSWKDRLAAKTKK